LIPNQSVAAWVNFNGINGVSIRSVSDVSNVYRNAQGNYTVIFTTPMPDSNYAFNITISDGNNFYLQPKVVSKTASSIQFGTPYATGTFGDASEISVTIFR
jgi:hypothetical protein